MKKNQSQKKREIKEPTESMSDYYGDLFKRNQSKWMRRSKLEPTHLEIEFNFEGTPAELEAQQQNVRDTRQYLYSAGLTNLQGEIDKETQSLKNEGSKQVAKIGAAGNLYSNLVSGFWG